MSGIRINIEEASNDGRWPIDLEIEEVYGITTTTTTIPTIPTTNTTSPNSGTWHIPRPSLVGKSEKDSDNGSNWAHHHLHPNSSSRGSTSSQGSTASTHSAASGTLLLTAANLASLAAMHPPTITTPKTMDNVSVASSTHFTVVNGLGRPTTVYKKSWCARHQVTVLVCTMSFLFMVGLIVGVVFMEMKHRDKYD